MGTAQKKGSVVNRAVFLWVVIVFSLGFWPAASRSATDDDEGTAPRTSVVRKEPANSSDAAVTRKLNEILANQKAILANQEKMFQRLDAVMEELRIVKVRATLRSGS